MRLRCLSIATNPSRDTNLWQPLFKEINLIYQFSVRVLRLLMGFDFHTAVLLQSWGGCKGHVNMPRCLSCLGKVLKRFWKAFLQLRIAVPSFKLYLLTDQGNLPVSTVFMIIYKLQKAVDMLSWTCLVL